MPMTSLLQNALLDEYFSVERFMSLHKGAPGEAGSFSDEVAAIGTGYARQSLAGKLGIASGGLITNTGTITFPVVTSEYGAPITHFAIVSAATGGQIGLWGYFSESVLKGIGQAYQYPPGALRFQFR